MLNIMEIDLVDVDDLIVKKAGIFVLGLLLNMLLHSVNVGEFWSIMIVEYPTIKPNFLSDGGYQYTSKSFMKKLDDAGMTQSMSRVSR